MSTTNDELERLRLELREVHAELDRIGVAPGQAAARRLRDSSLISRNAMAAIVHQAECKPYRRKLPRERDSITHKVAIAGFDVYITVGLYEDGSPGEVFFRIAKEGSTIKGLLDSFGIALSWALQYGTPLVTICDKFEDVGFEPAGFTSNDKITPVKSIVDYLAKWLRARFLTPSTTASEVVSP